MIALTKRLWRKATFFFRVWDAIRFLDRQCLSIKLGNESGQFVGHWNCEGDFLHTVDVARDRIGQQTTRVKEHGHNHH